MGVPGRASSWGPGQKGQAALARGGSAAGLPAGLSQRKWPALRLRKPASLSLPWIPFCFGLNYGKRWWGQ